MKSIKFIVEKTSTGYSAYAEDFPVYTVASDMRELKKNILDAINTHLEGKESKLKLSDLDIRIDIPSFFEFYNEINAFQLSKRIGINRTLLSQYVTGTKTPSHKQVEKIMTGIRSLGQDLAKVELI